MACVALVGCVAGTVNKLDAASRDDWQVCQNLVARAQCGTTAQESLDSSGYFPTGTLMCMNQLAEQYADTPRPARKQWLVRRGCPRDMVGEDVTPATRKKTRRPAALPRDAEADGGFSDAGFEEERPPREIVDVPP